MNNFTERKNQRKLAEVRSVFFSWQHFYPAQISGNSLFRVYLDEIPMVSALALDRQDRLYVTQEFRNEKGVLFRMLPDGKRQEIMGKLSKPDGLVPFRDGIAISQEAGEHPLQWWREGRVESLFSGNSIEGIATDGYHLFAIEDLKHHGRLLKFDPETKTTSVLRETLEEGEGIAVCPDGNLFYTEKKRGWIKKYRPGSTDEIVVRALREPGFLMCNTEGLWITEDATHRARLLLLDKSGTLRTILSHLRSPQSIISLRAGRLLLAEQGRGRILEIDYRPETGK